MCGCSINKRSPCSSLILLETYLCNCAEAAGLTRATRLSADWCSDVCLKCKRFNTFAKPQI